MITQYRSAPNYFSKRGEKEKEKKIKHLSLVTVCITCFEAKELSFTCFWQEKIFLSKLAIQIKSDLAIVEVGFFSELACKLRFIDPVGLPESKKIVYSNFSSTLQLPSFRLCVKTTDNSVAGKKLKTHSLLTYLS